MKKLTSLVVAALAVAVFAQAPHGKDGRPPIPGGLSMGMDPVVRMVSNPKIAEKLGITAEQQARLDACLKGGREEGSERQKKAREALQKQVKLLEADTVDEAAVMAAIDEVFEIRKEMAKAQTRRIIAVKAILTPEQIAKGLEALRQQRAPRREGHARRAEGDHGPRKEGDRPNKRRAPHVNNPPSAEK